MPPTSAVIKFENVTKRFGAQLAVDNVSLSAAMGETVALLGPSGCGKTTTLRLIAGFETPDRGSIEIDGEPVVGKRPYERNVGLLFQHYALFPHMSVFGNVAYGLKQRRWPKTEIVARVDAMLKLVQLSGLETRRPSQLSGGQQQRVALARVMATKPKLILLDEPLSALDAKLREELRIELKQILATVGSTAVVVTHDQDEAMSLADRIIVMNRGRIEQQGTPNEIYARPASMFVATFIGRTNWFHGRLGSSPMGGNAVLTTSAGTNLRLPAIEYEAGTKLSIGIRPERIILTLSDSDAGHVLENTIPGEVIEAISMGAAIHYAVVGGEGRMMVIEPNRHGQKFQKGDRVKLAFKADDCLAFLDSNAQ